jgi:hypothetical protein
MHQTRAMGDAVTSKIRYDGDLMSMRMMARCLQAEGLQVTVEWSQERRDVGAAIVAVLAVTGSVDGAIDLAGRIRDAIKKYRERNPGAGDKIEVDGEPDDGGFLG